MIDHLEVTKFLNELRMKNTEMPIREYRQVIKEHVSYNNFSTLLLEEGYAYSINRVVRFSTKPIHKDKVKILIKESRELYYGYMQKTKRELEEKKKEREEISRCIQFLIDKGYTILHKDMNF